MRNVDIRAEVKEAGIRLWQIAEQLGMSDSAFSRHLRHELPDTRKTEIRKIIGSMSKARKK